MEVREIWLENFTVYLRHSVITRYGQTPIQGETDVMVEIGPNNEEEAKNPYRLGMSIKSAKKLVTDIQEELQRISES